MMLMIGTTVVIFSLRSPLRYYRLCIIMVNKLRHHCCTQKLSLSNGLWRPLLRVRTDPFRTMYFFFSQPVANWRGV